MDWTAPPYGAQAPGLSGRIITGRNILKLTHAVPAALLALGLVAAASPAQAVTVKQVRKADFVTALSDTRATGHYDFLAEGVRLYTEGATSTDKVAEYIALTGELPTSVSYQWYGTVAQPGAQVVFDKDATTGNGNDYNVLVGEQVYSTNQPGQPLTEWWYTGGSAKAATNGITCPVVGGGFGSDCHGTLAQWGAALTTERVYAGGFSLGSGVKGDGVLRSLTYNDTEYVFTDTPATPAVVTKDVTGTVSATVKKNRVAKLALTTDALPAGTTQGKALSWRVVVDGATVATFEQDAAKVSKLVYAFKKNTGTHKVVVFANDAKVATVKVRTNQA